MKRKNKSQIDKEAIRHDNFIKTLEPNEKEITLVLDVVNEFGISKAKATRAVRKFKAS